MEYSEYKRLAEREDTHWWHASRRRILQEVLKSHLPQRSTPYKILDFGCGPGGNILFLKDFGEVYGVDASKEALSFAKKRGYASLFASSGETLPFPDGTFDIVVALDVIEHINDDIAVLKELSRALAHDGLFLVTVPAHKWLWSRHDEALHHKRRYTRRELFEKIKDAGFSVHKSSHFVIPGILFFLVRKTVYRVKKISFPQIPDQQKSYDVILPPIFNKIMNGWMAIERRLIRRIRIPWGTSLFVAAKKEN